MTSMILKNKIVVITGGAGLLGKEFAKAVVEHANPVQRFASVQTRSNTSPSVAFKLNDCLYVAASFVTVRQTAAAAY